MLGGWGSLGCWLRIRCAPVSSISPPTGGRNLRITRLISSTAWCFGVSFAPPFSVSPTEKRAGFSSRGEFPPKKSILHWMFSAQITPDPDLQWRRDLKHREAHHRHLCWWKALMRRWLLSCDDCQGRRFQRGMTWSASSTGC